MTSITVDQMAACLTALTQPDTNTIRQAEQQLKPVLKDPASMNVLWQLAAHHTDIAVRHVATIVLRKRLPGHYSNMAPEQQQEWQTQLLQLLAQEGERPIRNGLVGIVAALQQVDGAASPAVLQFLQAAFADVRGKELCFVLLQEMTETIGMHWKEHLGSLMELYRNAIVPNDPACTAAVSSAGRLMSYWCDEPELETMAPLLPTMIVVAQHSQDEDFLTAFLDVLYDLAYAPAGALAQYTGATVEFCLHCLANRNMDIRVRDAAALVIATTVEARPKTFGRETNMLNAVLDTLFQLMQESQVSAAGALFETNPSWRQDLGLDDDDDDPDSPTESSMAQGTLDMMSCEIPKKFIWEPALQRCMERMASPDPKARKAGVAGLGVIAEGCAEPMTASMAQIMPHVLQAAQDAEPSVRECACFCLGQLSEHCQPDILQYNTQILPIVFQLLDDQSVAVQATSCYVLEMFCERLDPAAVRPLLDQLVRKLAHMLEVTDKRSVKEMAVAALAATAVAAEDEFAPYVDGVAKLMTDLMNLQNPELFSLRGRALECMGHVGIAVGNEVFRPYFPATMQSAMQGLTMDSTDLEEFAYAAFANLSKVMKEEFAPALDDLVPHLVKVIDQDEGQLEKSDDAAGQFTGLDDSDEEDEGNYVLHVRTALMEVKKGAITALSEMGAHTGAAFVKHIDAVIPVLQKALGTWHPLVKNEAADALPSMIVASIAAFHNGEIKWKKGDMSATYLAPQTANLVSFVLAEEIKLLEEPDKVVVAKAVEAIQTTVELCGPHALGPVFDQLLQASHQFLTRQSPCHKLQDEFGEAVDGDDEHDVTLQAVCDLIGAFGRVAGDQFAVFLSQFLPVICEYNKSSRPNDDRSMALGCLAEIAQELSGQVMLPHWKTFYLPALDAGLIDADDSTRRNAAFCAGLCAESLQEHISTDIPNILNKLGAILHQSDAAVEDAALGCVDNAAAAVARIIMAMPAQVPMEQVVPVFLKVLPCKSDLTENETVYNCILGLISMNHTALPRAEVQRVLSTVLNDPDSKLEDEMRQRIASAMKTLG